MLEKLGYQVQVKSNGIEGVELFKQDPGAFDLIITDQTMPQMLGTEMVVELLKIRAGIPMILCTGYSSKVDGKMAQEIGIKAFLMKPVSRNDLGKTVRKVLDEGR